jgi:CubicO group peptidase (beta-lactamase class C family)
VIGSAATTPKRTLSIRRVEYVEGLTGFEAQLDSLRVELHTPGMSAAIVQDEEVIRSMGFGLADVDEGRLATPTTSLHLASLTKTFTATIVMQLVEQGLVDLDDPVGDYTR